VAQVHKRKADLSKAGQMAESQISELQNMRVLLEEARGLARNLAYHRRAALESTIGQTLDEIDWQIEDLRRDPT
jgi:hypothetical protein